MDLVVKDGHRELEEGERRTGGSPKRLLVTEPKDVTLDLEGKRWERSVRRYDRAHHVDEANYWRGLGG